MDFIISSIIKTNSQIEKKINFKQLILVALFIGYIVFVCELTIFGRGSSHFMQMNLQPFSGYIDAWKKYSLRDLQNCIFNILMFVPLGVFLPLLFSKFKLFKWLLPVVMIATLSIESYQTLTGAGIFELDDLINNSLGGIIGYQLYRLGSSIVQHKKNKNEKFDRKPSHSSHDGFDFYWYDDCLRSTGIWSFSN